jgi:hypothetical protein
METEKKNKKFVEKIGELIGYTLLFIFLCLFFIMLVALFYLTLLVIFGNPISLGLICGTIIIIVLIWQR